MMPCNCDVGSLLNVNLSIRPSSVLPSCGKFIVSRIILLCKLLLSLSSSPLLSTLSSNDNGSGMTAVLRTIKPTVKEMPTADLAEIL
jgi:hypothetical protein